MREQLYYAVHGSPRSEVSVAVHRILEIELVLDVHPVLDQVTSESRLAFKGKAVRSASAASHRDVRVIDHQPVVVSAVETIVNGRAEFFDQIVLLLG